MRRVLVVAVLAAFSASAVAGAAAPAPAPAEVAIPARLYSPADLDVLVGTSVTWRNSDHTAHTVTQDDDVFDSGQIGTGETFTQVFAKLGAFRYHCTIHKFMRGTVRVYDVVLRGAGRPVRVGRRVRLEGVAPAGVTDVVLERTSPRPAAVVGHVTARADGSFGFSVRAPEPRSYRVRAGSAASPVVHVGVSPRVTVDRRGARVVVEARPARPGSRVALQVYDREHFTFVTVARGRLDSSSRTVIPYAPTAVEHVRAVVRGRDGWSDGASRALVVRHG